LKVNAMLFLVELFILLLVFGVVIWAIRPPRR